MLKFNLRLVLGVGILVSLYFGAAIAAAFQNELVSFDLPEPRIINGTVASLDATRHQVSIRMKRNDGFFFGTGHICGGSLISENVVLSAAHCIVNYNIMKPRGTFYKDDYFIAVMGDLDRFNIGSNTLVFDIAKIVKRVEIFDLQTYQHDIALLILNGKVPAQHPTVRPITLNDGPLANNTLCHATGWGQTEQGTESDVLLTVELPIIDSDDCRNKTLYENLVTEGMFCAGYLDGERDSCSGDSGGPLVCGGVQAGIISWASGCAQPLAPGVYTNITFYKDWILQAAANHNGTLPKFAGDDGIEEEDDGDIEEEDDGGIKNKTDGGIEDKTEGGGIDDKGDGVTRSSCSLTLISLTFILNFYLSKTK